MKATEFQDLKGLPLDEFTEKAKERGVGSVRVTVRDGEHLMTTKDLRRDRLNVEVTTETGKEIVTAVNRFA